MTLRVLKSMEIFIKIKTTAKQQQQRKLISNGLYFQNLISMFSCIQGHLSFLRGDNYIISHRAFPWALCSPSGKEATFIAHAAYVLTAGNLHWQKTHCFQFKRDYFISKMWSLTLNKLEGLK